MTIHSNQTTMWSWYAFYKIYQVISWGIVIMDISIRRYGTVQNEKSRGTNYCLMRIVQYELCFIMFYVVELYLMYFVVVVVLHGYW